MFTLIVTEEDGTERRKDAGSWEDHAREIYGAFRRKLIHNTWIKARLELVKAVELADGGMTHETILSHDQRGE